MTAAIKMSLRPKDFLRPACGLAAGDEGDDTAAPQELQNFTPPSKGFPQFVQKADFASLSSDVVCLAI
jgi:hypothetical protein